MKLPLISLDKDPSINQILRDRYRVANNLLSQKDQLPEYIQSITPKNDLDFKRTTHTANSKKNVEFTYSSIKQKVVVSLVSEKGIVPVKDYNLPKELNNINSPEVLNAFVDSAYTKISKLSNGEYKIDVNVKGLGGARGRQVDRITKAEMVDEIVYEAARRGIEVVNNIETRALVDKTWEAVKRNASNIFSGAVKLSIIVGNAVAVATHCTIF
jgi:hypothetical protein